MGSQEGRLVFAVAPGTYEASIGFPGFKAIRRKLEFKPEKKGSGAADYIEVHIRLEPDEN
jgi:hypothetical protein